MFLCVCKAVRVSEAVDAARAGFDSADSIRRLFSFDDDECCGRCADHIDSVAALISVKMRQSDQVSAPSSTGAGAPVVT